MLVAWWYGAHLPLEGPQVPKCTSEALAPSPYPPCPVATPRGHPPCPWSSVVVGSSFWRVVVAVGPPHPMPPEVGPGAAWVRVAPALTPHAACKGADYHHLALPWGVLVAPLRAQWPCASSSSSYSPSSTPPSSSSEGAAFPLPHPHSSNTSKAAPTSGPWRHTLEGSSQCRFNYSSAHPHSSPVHPLTWATEGGKTLVGECGF